MLLDVAQEVRAMRHMTVAELQARYAEVFGEEARCRHKGRLIRRIAWRLQANADGGLSERALRRAEGLADEIFKPLVGITGDVGIAHTRYKTHGSGGTNNAQPFFDPMAGIALAHNGHVTNVPQIEDELKRWSQRGSRYLACTSPSCMPFLSSCS